MEIGNSLSANRSAGLSIRALAHGNSDFRVEVWKHLDLKGLRISDRRPIRHLVVGCHFFTASVAKGGLNGRFGSDSLLASQ